MKPLTVYTVIPPKHTASFWYRLQTPVLTARDLGLPVRVVIDEQSSEMPVEERIRQFTEADLILLYQPVGDAPIQNMRGLQSILPSKRDGEWKWAPNVVVESDDNLFNVSPLNQAFKSLGIRDMEGNMIPSHSKDGRPMQIGVSKDGQKEVLWEQGKKGFDIQANRQRIASYRKMLQMADAVTCSTQGVADAIKKELTPRRIEVFPNLMRLDHYEQVELKEDPDKVKILWQGGIAHYEDWFPLREALGNITRKYPEVHWLIWGAIFPWAKELIPADRYTFYDWCPYQEYKLRLAMKGHDISLAPLQSHVFNDCRSAIKFYEASVLKKPAASLCQNTGPYKQEVIDGETGLLFDGPEDFEVKLSLLIEDSKERRRLASNAKDWVAENRNAMKEVPKQVAFWEQMREERYKEQPHVTDEMWQKIEAEAEQEALAVS